MSQIVSPEEFVCAFHPLVVAEQKEILKRWWASQRDYTSLFLKAEHGILPRTAKSLGLDCRREFLHVDAAFATRIGQIHFFAVAIEHENYAKGSTWEMNKLAYVDTPLKVLITYPDNETVEGHLLREYERIIQITQVKNELSQHRRHLAIFGSRDGDCITWRYYTYTAAGFKPLTDQDELDA